MKISGNILILFVAVVINYPIRAQSDDDWTEIQEVLTNCIGIYSGVNNNIATSGMPDGPLLGNGKVGVVGASDNNWARFYITTTNFWTGAHLNAKPLPIGGVDIIATGGSGTGVKQEQDMLNAEIRTHLDYGSLNIRTWVSATSDLVINEIWTSGTDAINISLETWSHITNTALYPVSNGVSGKSIGWASRETQSGKDVDWVCRAALATKVIGADYNISLSGNNKTITTFTLEPGKRIYVITAVHSGKNITDHITESITLAEKQNDNTIGLLHDAHLKWWKNYWLKSFVRTYDTLLEKFYYGALYEAACCYREGSICPGLFGAWVTTDKPNWDGNYTLSYNHQSTVVGFASSNRPELLLPYIQQRYDWEAEGRKRAQRGDINFITGNRWGSKFKDGIFGILEPITQAPWGNSASGDLYMGMLSGAVWAALPITWYCNYTQDEDYLEKIAYPYLKEIADFWEAYLVKEDGKWIIKYAAFQEWKSNDNNNPTLDNAFVKEFFRNMIRYSIILDTDADKRVLWKDIVLNMKDLPTMNLCGMDVFKLCDEEGVSGGNNWPGIAFLAGHTTEVTMSSHDDLKRRYINTLDAFNPWESPHICSTGFLWASAVKGGYPAQSLLDWFKILLTKKMRRNFTVPTGGHGTESIANIEYINAAMLQSQEGFLRLFAGWPEPAAKFKRLRAQGAFLVSSELVDGKVSYVEIHSEKGLPCSFLNPWPGYSIVIEDGYKKQLEFSAQSGKINFLTKPGGTYYIRQGTVSVEQKAEGVLFETIKIGDQVWMKNNLDLSTFRNGDPIPEARTKAEWIQAGRDKKPAYCYYDNNKSNGKRYGKIYNWFAINDPRGLIPKGYHVPSEAEWLQLISFLGGSDIAGKELKSEKTFGASPGGYRNNDGNFYGAGLNGYWWSSSVVFGDIIWDFVIDHKSSYLYRNYSRKPDGLYIRCIKD